MKDTMLSRLLRGLGAPEASTTEATTVLQSEFEAFKASASAEKEELATALQTALEAVSNADQVVLALTEKLDAATAKIAELTASAEQARLTSRKEKIVAAVGTAKADALMAATDQLDEAQFNAVIGAMSTSLDIESKSKLFSEQGVAAEADANQVAPVSKEMQILAQKYNTQKGA